MNGKGRVPRKWKHHNSSSNLNSLQAFVWGDGSNGLLGLGNEKLNVLTPVILPGVKKDGAAGETLEVKCWQQVACGDFHTAAVTPTGDLYTWGEGDNGQLGHGNNEHEVKPKLVTCLTTGKKVVHVNCGDCHTAVVTTEGELYTCGKGGEGQLGHGNLNHLWTFTKVEGLDGHIVSQVVCSDEYTVALTSEGSVYTFGSNKCGQIGHGGSTREMTPKRVTGCLEYKRVVFVAANGYHSACITEDGDTYTWGTGEFGTLGHGDKMTLYYPQLVAGLAGKKAKEVACGAFHSIVCTDDGRVYSFGSGIGGRLGHGSSEDKFTPTLIQQVQLEGKFVVQVACGWLCSMALTSDGRLYTWGKGESGCLGHGSELSSAVPSVVESLMDYKVVQIASKNVHSVALVEPKNVHSVALVEPKRSSYAKKMKAMVNDETCSDVVFLLKDNERVYANKGLLIGQSDYFRAMFRSGMKDESIANEVELLRDCSKSVFLLFLEYLYLGEVDIGMDNAIELYALSDRYQENDLSMKCLGMIEIGLSDTNAIELLVEADGSGLDTLKDVCMEYVVMNYGKCFKKERIVSLSPSLMEELLCKIGE